MTYKVDNNWIGMVSFSYTDSFVDGIFVKIFLIDLWEPLIRHDIKLLYA